MQDSGQCRSTNAGAASSKQANQPTEADDARRRFGNAKSISSSMFDDDAKKPNDYEKQAMLSKFSVSQRPCLAGHYCAFGCCSLIPQHSYTSKHLESLESEVCNSTVFHDMWFVIALLIVCPVKGVPVETRRGDWLVHLHSSCQHNCRHPGLKW